MAKDAKLILAFLETDVAASVVLNGTTVYHEDNDKGATNATFSAKEVAQRLSKALGLPIDEVVLTYSDVEGGGEAWNFDGVEVAAVLKAEEE